MIACGLVMQVLLLFQHEEIVPLHLLTQLNICILRPFDIFRRSFSSTDHTVLRNISDSLIETFVLNLKHVSIMKVVLALHLSIAQ